MAQKYLKPLPGEKLYFKLLQYVVYSQYTSGALWKDELSSFLPTTL